MRCGRIEACSAVPSRKRCAGSRRSPRWCDGRSAIASWAGSRFRREHNVSVSVAAANRDPTRYPDPDRFDPTRRNIAHLTFGGGPHLCLGMHLARMEATVAINALLDRLPDLRLDSSAPTPHVVGVAFRSPATLPVEFTPA